MDASDVIEIKGVRIALSALSFGSGAFAPSADRPGMAYLSDYDRVLALQKHFGMANKDIDLILTSSDKVTKRALKIGQVELEDHSEDAPPADGQGPKLVSGGMG